MMPLKRKNLERAGFKVGTVQEFLNLSDEEMALIDLKVHLVILLRNARSQAGISQQALAKRIGSSQSRIAKMEGGDSNISLDLICKALFALKIPAREIGKAFSPKKAA
jgi:ribosome-binding protein aMBF1 (putative translation factor)